MMLMLSEVDDDAPKVDVDERERERVMARNFKKKERVHDFHGNAAFPFLGACCEVVLVAEKSLGAFFRISRLRW